MFDFIEKNELKRMGNRSSNEDRVINNLKKIIVEYLTGKKIELFEKFNLLNIEINLKEVFPSKYSLKVIKYLIENVKYGDTTSYSDVGKGIGSNAYRAIGSILKNNPLPLIIPCHRVVRKNGEIGGYMGKFDDWQQNLKKFLIEMEHQN